MKIAVAFLASISIPFEGRERKREKFIIMDLIHAISCELKSGRVGKILSEI